MRFYATDTKHTFSGGDDALAQAFAYEKENCGKKEGFIQGLKSHHIQDMVSSIDELAPEDVYNMKFMLKMSDAEIADVFGFTEKRVAEYCNKHQIYDDVRIMISIYKYGVCNIDVTMFVRFLVNSFLDM